VQHRRGTPAAARLGQLVLGLVVARHEHGGCLDHHQHVDQALDSAMHRAEVPGRHDHVRVACHLGDPARLLEVAVDVAEGEQPHGAPS
jgi:hypothetical protein